MEVSFVPTGLLADETSDSESDRQMLDFAALAKAKRKREELIAFKVQAAAQAAQAQGAKPLDDDDELFIAEDMKSVARDEAQARRGAIARGELPSVGAKKQLAAAGSGARRGAAMLDDIAMRRALQEAAKPSFSSISRMLLLLPT